MRIKQNYLRKLLLMLFLFIALLLSGVAVVYHHFTDYDISSSLLRASKILPASTNMMDKNPVLNQIHHVYVIVEENHDWNSIYKNPDAPFINKVLLPQSAYAQQYYNVPKNLNELHPSEPNYIFLEAGKIAFSAQTFTTDNPPSAQNSIPDTNHLVSLLSKHQLSWKSYQEDISGADCPIAATQDYAPKHNPFIYFQDVSGNPPSVSNTYCKAHIRPFSELTSDIAKGTVANYNFITPNLQHDMHDGTITQADTWLASVVPHITNSPTFKKDGALFITWDEGNSGEEGNNPIGMIITSHFIKKNYTNSITYTHASFVKTIESIFHVSPLLGMAGDPQTRDLTDMFVLKK